MKDISDIQPKVSIVIPLYNTANFVAECIASIKRQTVSNFECFIIDDVSTDKSCEMAAKAIADDSRFHLLKSNKHIGCGATRNIGLGKAVGEFIYIMDSDDIIVDDCFEKAINFIEANDLGMALFNVKNVNANAFLHMFVHEVNYLKRKKCYGIASGKDMLVEMIKNDNFSCNVFTYMARRTEVKFKFPEVHLDEDMLYTIKNMASIKRVGHLDEELYIKRARRSSLLNGGMTFQKTISMMEVVIEMSKWIEDGIAYEDFNQDFADALEEHLDKCSAEVKARWMSLPAEEKSKLKDVPYSKRTIFRRFIS